MAEVTNTSAPVEATPAAQPPKKKSSALKIILIILAVILVLGICCFATIYIGGTKALDIVYKQLEPIKLELIQPLCENRTLTKESYETLFTESFRDQYTLTDAQIYISLALPDDFSCETFNANNLVDLIKNGLEFNATTNADGSVTITFSYVAKVDGEDTKVTYEIVQEDGKWKINDIN